jgi:hypothetical protein
MITIQHQEKQIEIHARFSIRWIHQIGRIISQMFDFSDVRAVQKQKEEMLKDFDRDFFKMH